MTIIVVLTLSRIYTGDVLIDRIYGFEGEINADHPFLAMVTTSPVPHKKLSFLDIFLRRSSDEHKTPFNIIFIIKFTGKTVTDDTYF